MKSLVGYTGFVGSNLAATSDFDGLYNSRNIREAFDTHPDLLIYAGLRAEKYLANTFPEKDLELIREAEDNIEKINPEKLVLISTIDVFKDPNGADENTPIETEGLHPYGYDRHLLEEWVREKYPDALIVRLPGLFGKNIKKNFIYDYIHVIPAVLKEEKFKELSSMDARLKNWYVDNGNGFYKADIREEEREEAKKAFEALGFSALNFTDSRSVYQFYDLSRLYKDIEVLLQNDIRLFHPATEPVSAGEVYRYLTGKDFVNEVAKVPAYYDYRTIHSSLFGRSDGYIASKEEVLKAIKDFTEGEKR